MAHQNYHWKLFLSLVPTWLLIYILYVCYTVHLIGRYYHLIDLQTHPICAYTPIPSTQAPLQGFLKIYLQSHPNCAQTLSP